ncbi:MAG: DJ-1/PfpI family protein [Candidatus Omnitrophica bacterium]|nr:DJ-1/PfpI family protein [Candidatus Omnitrophota bacterium]
MKKVIIYIVVAILGGGIVFAQEVKMKKVVMIIAPEGFRDEELLEPKKILEEAGISVTVASTTTSRAKGMLGAIVSPDVTLTQVKVDDFDAVIFVGGVGASQYWDDPLAHRIAQEIIAQDKVLGAICIAPVTLANAGLLKGKRATVWSSEAGQLKRQGALYTGKAVEEDGKIVTASGPTAAKEFGQTILKLLK